MRIQRYACFSVAVVFAMCMTLYAADFKVYPGAKLDEKLTKEANEFGKAVRKDQYQTKASIYVTSDSFEKVADFYKTMGKEYKMPGAAGKTRKLPSGKDLKQVYVIFDGASDLGSSKLWAKVQRPYISFTLEEGPDMTYIAVSEKK